MAEMEARSAGVGRFPVEAGQARAVEVVPAGLWSVMPFAGCADAVGRALRCGFPAPGRAVRGGGLRALWTGREAAMVMGPRPEGLDGLAAITDQTDGWCVVRLEGAAARDVLARLCPLDLREPAFPEGSATRTLLGHMTAVIARHDGAFEILTMRSMAATLAHELERAMRGVAARRAMG